jgi:hypothetical protein
MHSDFNMEHHWQNIDGAVAWTKVRMSRLEQSFNNRKFDEARVWQAVRCLVLRFMHLLSYAQVCNKILVECGEYCPN